MRNPPILLLLSAFLLLSSIFYPTITLADQRILNQSGSDGPLTQSTPLGITTRVSINGSGEQGNDASHEPSISADGRYVAFQSLSTNLVPDDIGNDRDIFVYDQQTGITERVSVSSSGVEGNAVSDQPSISADGRYVAFYSLASNLVSGDTGANRDIFVRDRQTDTTERVSLNSAEAQGNGSSYSPSISADGRYVAFYSLADNLVAGDTNASYDIFVRDRQTGDTELISVDSAEVQGNDRSVEPSISSDGRFVAFESDATNLVTGDTNAMTDTFVRDRQTGVTQRISVSSTGVQGNNESHLPSISGDGQLIAFESAASNLITGDTNNRDDIFVYDRQTGLIERVSVTSAGAQGNGNNTWPSISGNGRYVIFRSISTNLVPGDNNAFADILVHDRQTNMTRRISVSSAGAQANSINYSASISGDGQFIAFESAASNLVTGDTNGSEDIFVHNQFPPVVSPVGAAPFRNYFITSTPTLTWNRISGVADYEIEIDTDPNFGTPGHYARTVNGLSHEVDSPLGIGIWYWRVRAVGGAWSVPERFVVDIP